MREDSDSLQETGAELAIDLAPVTKDRESPDLVRGDKQDSAADSVPSSRIEVSGKLCSASKQFYYSFYLVLNQFLCMKNICIQYVHLPVTLSYIL